MVINGINVELPMLLLLLLSSPKTLDTRFFVPIG
jgi:hypothetical protein